MLLDAFLAAKEDKAVAQIFLNLAINLSAQAIAMHIIVIATSSVWLLNLSIRPTRFMVD